MDSRTSFPPRIFAEWKESFIPFIFINGMTVTDNGTVHETEDRTLPINYFVHKIVLSESQEVFAFIKAVIM